MFCSGGQCFGLFDALHPGPYLVQHPQQQVNRCGIQRALTVSYLIHQVFGNVGKPGNRLEFREDAGGTLDGMEVTEDTVDQGGIMGCLLKIQQSLGCLIKVVSGFSYKL